MEAKRQYKKRAGPISGLREVLMQGSVLRHGGDHGPDMGRRGAAAAAEHPRPARRDGPHMPGKHLRRKIIYGFPILIAWQAGVGADDQRQIRAG